MDSETEEGREERIREMAKSRGYRLEKWGEGTPITSYDYSLVGIESPAIVVDRHQGLDFIEKWLTGNPDED
jgi:hypothetical protein